MRTEEYFLKLRNEGPLVLPFLVPRKKSFCDLVLLLLILLPVLAFADGKEKRTREECLDMIKSATKKNPNRNRNDNDNDKNSNNNNNNNNKTTTTTKPPGQCFKINLIQFVMIFLPQTAIDLI